MTPTRNTGQPSLFSSVEGRFLALVFICGFMMNCLIDVNRQAAQAWMNALKALAVVYTVYRWWLALLKSSIRQRRGA